MIGFSEAQHLILGQARSFGKEQVLLDDAAERIISEKITADRDYPPFNRATMDGYAITQKDWDSGLRSFSIRETIFAGNEARSEIAEGECYKIMTGAAVPGCADVVIRKEDVLEQPDLISCTLDNVMLYQHIAKRGEDLRKGDIINSEPVFGSPGMIGVLASIGKNEVLVEKVPNVLIVTTGDEIVNIESLANSSQVRNSNSHVLKALLKRWNIIPVSCIHVPDRPLEIESALQAALAGDIIITCGGVSAGDADYLPEVLEKLGAKKIFHKVAMKPGKPIWFGKFQNGPVVFALPGNPLSCLVTFTVFIEPFLSRSFGLTEAFQLSLPFKGARTKKNQLDEFFPVRITGFPSNSELIPFNGSGDITAAIHANGIARHEYSIAELISGDIIDIYPLFQKI